MAKKSIYSSFTLRHVSDIDELISFIKLKGNFHLDDYFSFKSQAEKTMQSFMICRRLKNEVYPLVLHSKPKEEVKNKTIKEEAKSKTMEPQNDVFWIKDYRASDFTLCEGRITIGNYQLKTVRVHATHPSLLYNIPHIFHIARETISQKAFHFVPYTDLSFLLNEIQKQIDEQNRKNVLEKIYRKWHDNLFDYLHITNVSTKARSLTTKTLEKLGLYTDMPLNVFLWDTTNNYKPNICVPKSDVTVEDGKITVLTENVVFSKQPYYEYRKYDSWNSRKEILLPTDKGYIETPSWDGFLKLLLRDYDNSIIKDCISELNDKYLKDTTDILESIKKENIISFDTYQSRNGFLQRNTNEYLYLYLDNNLKLSYPIKYKNQWSNNDLGLFSDRFQYSDNSLREIAGIIDRNWKMIYDSAHWLINFLPTDDEAEKPANIYEKINIVNTTLQSELRIVTDYYEGRLHIPNNWNCKDSVVTFFTENAFHSSDCECGRNSEKFRTFMIWSKDKDANTIFIIPTNTNYASYKFFVFSPSSLEVSSFVIWRYFSNCCMENKRQRLKLTEVFNLFGIYVLEKKATV